jgi:integrase
MENCEEELPDCILEAAAEANLELLPVISRERYEKQYDHFIQWARKKGTTNFKKEEVLLAYFLELSKIMRPNTLWSRFSMIKAVMKIRENLDIGQFYKLITFLKKQSVGFSPKKAKVFSKEDIAKFMEEAPDNVYLLIKVATIFGLAGACRRAELTNITLDDIEDRGNYIIVKINDSKNHTSRAFVISEEVNNGSYFKLVKKYTSLRSPKTPHRRFFVQFKHGKCTTQCTGINTFGKMPSEIAAYLKLPDPQCYTGHSFRRSSATFLADSGEEITNIKRLGGWKSTTVAEGYVEDSEIKKKNLCNKILTIKPQTEEQNAGPSNINQMTLAPPFSKDSNPSATQQHLNSAISLQKATNCTFNIHINNK